MSGTEEAEHYERPGLAAIFSLIDGVVLKPLPHRHPERLLTKVTVISISGSRAAILLHKYKTSDGPYLA
jgi:hypothetical protein